MKSMDQFKSKEERIKEEDRRISEWVRQKNADQVNEGEDDMVNFTTGVGAYFGRSWDLTYKIKMELL